MSASADGRPVAVLCPNTHELLEAHLAVPWAGVPLVASNTRLSAGEFGYVLDHLEASVLIHHPSLAELAVAAVAALPRRPVLVETGPAYESLLEGAQPRWSSPDDERALLSINYTSGTTGRPKGVMYHHRGAYLQALAMVAHTNLTPSARPPLDPADVPLQRLVLPLAGHRGRRDARLPPEGRSDQGLDHRGAFSVLDHEAVAGSHRGTAGRARTHRLPDRARSDTPPAALP